MDKNIVISLKTIAQAFLVGVAFYAVFRLGTIIGLVALALLITLSLEHTVQFISKQIIFGRKINRPIAVLVTYLSAFLLASLAISVGLDPLITQSQKLIQTLIKNQDKFTFGKDLNISLSDVIASFLATSGGVLSATRSIFNNVTAIFSVLILSIYMSIDWENVKSRFALLFKEEHREKVGRVMSEVEIKIGVWLRGQLILMISIGVLSYIGLRIVGVQFPLALAIMSGLFEIVPIIGPVFSAIVAALVAVVDSPVRALLIVLVFAMIQQVEGNVLVPKVMEKVSGISPIIILIAILIGTNLFGIMGAIAAIPVLMIGSIILRSVLENKSKIH